jgi:hypothetical protein
MPLRGEISISARRWDAHASATCAAWDPFGAAIRHGELATVVGFCVIGLLITACFIHSLPNFGGMVEALDLTP